MSSDDDHDLVPDMTDLSRFLVGTMSRETAAGDGSGSAPKLDDDVVVHAVHKLLSSSAACTGGVPPAEETPLQHPDLMFSSRCPVVWAAILGPAAATRLWRGPSTALRPG